MGYALKDAVQDCADNRRPEEVQARRLGRHVNLAERLGRHVAIVRNTDVKAVLGHRNALLDAARDAYAVLMVAKRSGDDGVDDLLDKLRSAIGAVGCAS